MMIGTGMRGLGDPTRSGTPQGVIPSMVPGSCCYDPDRPSWLPSWFDTAAEHNCMVLTNNCAGASLPVAPTSACAGVIGVDANGNKTCTQVASVNDPNNTQNQLSTNGQDFSGAWDAWISNVSTSMGDGQSNDSSLNWWVVGGIAILVVGLIGGTAAGRHLR